MARKPATNDPNSEEVKQKRTRKPKSPALTPDDLQAFATMTAETFAAARKDDSVTDADLSILFDRLNRIKALIGNQ